MKTIRIIVSFALIFGALLALVYAEEKNQIKITATVFKKDGSPAADIFLNLHKVKGTQWQIDMDGKGTVTNPLGKCDSKGQLTILVSKDYLKPAEEFTLGRLLQYKLIDERGNLVTFKYPNKLETKTINLGKITLHPQVR
jgi:hypothetical protein